MSIMKRTIALLILCGLAAGCGPTLGGSPHTAICVSREYVESLETDCPAGFKCKVTKLSDSNMWRVVISNRGGFGSAAYLVVSSDCPGGASD